MAKLGGGGHFNGTSEGSSPPVELGFVTAAGARGHGEGMTNVLNVVTVHWQSPQWVDIQLRYLERNLDVPWRAFASLNGIDEALWDRFHYAADLDGGHAEKLNELARIVASQSSPDDLLVFLDGDAFPVQPVGSWLESLLSCHSLAALRRDENLGDPQPHPAFCVTTVGFWQKIGGDWRAGDLWENDAGTTTDVGARLLRTLREQDIPWRPILRTNTNNIHPIWFGVYEHRIYHHGAGFRPRVSRVDILREPDIYGSVDPLGQATDGAGVQTRDRAQSGSMKPGQLWLRDIRHAPTALGERFRRRGETRDQRRRDRRLRQDERQAAQVLSWLADVDGDFYLRLDSDAAPDSHLPEDHSAPSASGQGD